MNLNFTFILQIISFLLLLGLLKKFLYKPLTKYLDERAKAIHNMVEGAKEAEQKAQKYARQTHQALDLARADALKMKKEARRLSDEERRKIIEEAKKEARFLIEEARSQFGRERELAFKKIKSEVAALSVDIASKILGREIKPEDHQRLAEDSIAEIEDEMSRP